MLRLISIETSNVTYIFSAQMSHSTKNLLHLTLAYPRRLTTGDNNSQHRHRLPLPDKYSISNFNILLASILSSTVL